MIGGGKDILEVDVEKWTDLVHTVLQVVAPNDHAGVAVGSPRRVGDAREFVPVVLVLVFEVVGRIRGEGRAPRVLPHPQRPLVRDHETGSLVDGQKPTTTVEPRRPESRDGLGRGPCDGTPAISTANHSGCPRRRGRQTRRGGGPRRRRHNRPARSLRASRASGQRAGRRTTLTRRQTIGVRR